MNKFHASLSTCWLSTVTKKRGWKWKDNGIFSLSMLRNCEQDLLKMTKTMIIFNRLEIFAKKCHVVLFFSNDCEISDENCIGWRLLSDNNVNWNIRRKDHMEYERKRICIIFKIRDTLEPSLNQASDNNLFGKKEQRLLRLLRDSTLARGSKWKETNEITWIAANVVKAVPLIYWASKKLRGRRSIRALIAYSIENRSDPADATTS